MRTQVKRFIKLSADMKLSRVEFKMNSKQWGESNKVNFNSVTSLIMLNKRLMITNTELLL